MQIQPPTHQPLTTSANGGLQAIPLAWSGRSAGYCMCLIGKGFSLRYRPHVVTRAHQLPPGNQAGQLLDEEAAFAPATESELADELFISGFAAGRTADSGEQVSIASAGQIPISAWVRSPGHGL